MPHLSLVPRELDEQYPSMRAPADDRMEDYLKDENDVVFKHGMEIAEEIRAEMRSKGRTRYRAPADENLEHIGLVHEEKNEPNTEKEEPEDKDKVYDNNGYRYLPKANAICRRSAKARYHGAPHRVLQRRRRPHRVHGGAGGSVRKIECVMQGSLRESLREFYDHRRFLALTHVPGNWPKLCVLSCCPSIRLSTLC